VAYDSQHAEYLVVWQERQDHPDIYGQRVSANGAAVGARIPVSAAPLNQERPRVAYNSRRDEYLVVWQDGTGEASSGGYNYIHGQRLSWDGQLIGSMIVINRTTAWQIKPDVAYNHRDDEYLVVWQDGGEDIHSQRLSGDGLLIVGPFPICTAVRHQLHPRVAYNPHSNEYLVVWDDYRDHQQWDIYGRRVTSFGSPYGPDIAICTMPNDQFHPDVDFCPLRNEFLVVWADETVPLYPDLFGALVSESGLVGAPFVVSAAAYGQEDPDVSYNPVHGEYLVAWTNNRPWDIRGQRMSPLGTFVGGEIVICNAQEKQHLPVLAVNTNTGGYIVAWEDFRNDYYMGYVFDVYAYVKP
jgi:hypothetical protein